MKRIFTLILAMVLAVGVFSACELFKPKPQEGSKEITVIINLSAYEGTINVDEGVEGYTDKVKQKTLTTEDGYLIEVLNVLKEEKWLDFSGSESSYGFFIDKVDNVQPASNQFFSIYTDDEEFAFVDTDGSPFTKSFDGKDYYSSSKGVSDLPVKDGKTYIISLEGF